MIFLHRSLAYTLISSLFLSIAPMAQALPKDEGAKNLSGSAYFSWKIKNPISALDNAPKVIGYGCHTRDTIGGMAKNAYVYRYAIKAQPKSEKWWLEYQEGLSITPTAKGYSAKKIPAPESIAQFQADVTDANTGWFKKDFEADGMGAACVDGGISAAVKQLEETHQITVTVENGKRR
jgi:hypothetical protein